jgi:phosphodiesterase/alkaline phosphatase D-like protein
MRSAITVLALALTTSVVAVGPAAAQYGTNEQGKQKITNGPVVEYTTDQSANIAWSTKLPGGTYIAYGTDRNNLSQRAQKSWGGTNHRVEIKNLEPSKTYYFQVRSENAASGGQGADVQSAIESFTTQAKGQSPDRDNRNVGVNSGSNSGSGESASGVNLKTGPVLEYVADDNAVVAWTSNKGTNMSVKYGTDRNNLSQSASTTDMGGTNHRVKLSNLQPSTTYYIQVEQNGQPVGSVEQFKTVAKGAQPKRENTDLSANQ